MSWGWYYAHETYSWSREQQNILERTYFSLILVGGFEIDFFSK